MNFDFPSFMVACALVTGGIWAADKFWFAKNRLKLAGATADAGATDEHAQVPTSSGEAIHSALRSVPKASAMSTRFRWRR